MFALLIFISLLLWPLYADQILRPQKYWMKGVGGDSLLCRQCMFHEGGDASLAQTFSILLFRFLYGVFPFYSSFEAGPSS